MSRYSIRHVLEKLYKVFIYLLKKLSDGGVEKERAREGRSKREREEKRQRAEKFHILVYYPNSCNSQIWARQKLGTLSRSPT